jgi:hypothetical protein
MNEFKIKLARIEAFDDGAQGKQVCAVFHIERGPLGFHVPIYLQGHDFDNAEVVQAARNSLYRMFAELAKRSKVWELSPAELERLSKMDLRPGVKSSQSLLGDGETPKPSSDPPIDAC